MRVFRGEEMGESQKDLMRACAREEIDVRVPFEELPKVDQDFVINGEKKNGEYEEDEDSDRWYGVRGFFKWLESKTYKMHVRVLLSRYRAYTTCPSCKGGRFQPRGAELPHRHAAAFRGERQMARNAADFTARSRRFRFRARAKCSPASRFRLTTPQRRCCGGK